jgi:hypothetical protein
VKAKTVGEARPAITATNIAAIVFFLCLVRVLLHATKKTAESVKKKNARRSHDAVILGYDNTDNVRETHQHAGDFKEPSAR